MWMNFLVIARRALLPMVLVGLAAGSTLCQSASLEAASSEPTGSESPSKGGTLVYAVLGEPPTIDCHAASSFATLHDVAPHYSVLVKLDPEDTSRRWRSCGLMRPSPPPLGITHIDMPVTPARTALGADRRRKNGAEASNLTR
jgi:ABC-type transport system substrate-binding protein